MTSAWPGDSANPSLGSGAQMKVDAVTLDELLHCGGSPVEGKPNAITSRLLVPSQLLATRDAMHAGGTLPVFEESGTSASLAPPGQSLATRQTWMALPPLPRTRWPALLWSKLIEVTLLGIRMPVRR